MSQLDGLLARSRAPGQFVERRHFTLSRDKAIEKQRDFALRHPSQYVLELVQAAVHAGATYIAVDARPDSLLVAWVGGDALDTDKLENIYDYLFADRTDASIRAYVQLAIGLLALSQRNPSMMRIESGGENSSVRMDLDADNEVTLGVPKDAIAGTYLFAQFDLGWFGRFSNTRHQTEQHLIEERCLYTPVPILLNGSAPFGYRAGRHIEIFGARIQQHFDEGGRRGVIAYHGSNVAPTGFRIVMGGSWVTTLPLDELATRPLVGVICDDNLRKTADQSDVVQDHRYVEMLHAVQPHATTVMEQIERNYQAPRLPPIPKAATPDPEVEAPRQLVEPEPLNDPIPQLGPRPPVRLHELRSLGDEPVFRVTPADSAGVLAAADPTRLPFWVLVLTEGQAVSLEGEVPLLAMHRLTTPADVDFVRRIMERSAQVREVEVGLGRGKRLKLRLHLEGRLPVWSRTGIPTAWMQDGATHQVGPLTELFGIAVPDLPGLSVIYEGRTPDRDDLTDKVLAQAWKLALPDDGPPHGPLMCALLGRQAIPRLIEEAGLRLAASLPDRWLGGRDADTLVLGVTRDGEPLTLQAFLDLQGTEQTVEVSAETLGMLQPLEQKFGFGHLTAADALERPVFGVGRRGGTWAWLVSDDVYDDQRLTHLIVVAPHFGFGIEHPRWNAATHPTPVVRAFVRTGIDTAPLWNQGVERLFEHLAEMARSGQWAPQIDLTGGRAEAMGRLALMQLAVSLDRRDDAMLSPTDGGALRPLTALAEERVRVAARKGVRLDEAHTFRLTRDEISALDLPELKLRFDDAPAVYRSLSQPDHPGWLVRHEVRVPGLQGWIGLRYPFDGTSGILVRTAEGLVALPQLHETAPCHGLLWPTRGDTVSAEQIKLLQLAGLQLYQELIDMLRKNPGEELVAAASLYSFAFVHRAFVAGGRKLGPGTASELARLVEVAAETGQRWGNLQRWLSADRAKRPPAPPQLVLWDDADDAPEEEQRAIQAVPLSRRLTAATGGRPEVAVGYSSFGAGPLVRIDYNRSQSENAVFQVNHDHPLTQKAALGSVRHRELLLLELARNLAVWGSRYNQPIDLLRVQQVLLAQRLGTD